LLIAQLQNFTYKLWTASHLNFVKATNQSPYLTATFYIN